MTVKDLNPNQYITTEIQLQNLEKLAEAISGLEILMNREFYVTSGLRSMSDQMRINPAVLNSSHLHGSAVDLLDVDGSIDSWCVSNLDALIRLGLYLESPTETPRWSHLQITPPKSGRRVFLA